MPRTWESFPKIYGILGISACTYLFSRSTADVYWNMGLNEKLKFWYVTRFTVKWCKIFRPCSLGRMANNNSTIHMGLIYKGVKLNAKNIAKIANHKWLGRNKYNSNFLSSTYAKLYIYVYISITRRPTFVTSFCQRKSHWSNFSKNVSKFLHDFSSHTIPHIFFLR